MKEFRGMKVVGKKISDKEIESRRSKLVMKKEANPKPRKHGKVRIKDEVVLGVRVTVPKSWKRFKGVCLGGSKKKCPNCDGRLMRWKEALNREHKSCSSCGYTTAKLPSDYM